MTISASVPPPEHLDVVIVGAGLSGIGAAVHLQKNCPNHTYAILEGRAAMGGTWDLFRYPGIRSDSDMYTLGYAFRPWTGGKAIAEGQSILNYIRDTAREEGVTPHIRCGHRVIQASWSTEHARWSLEIALDAQLPSITITCNFFWVCSGYYNYEQGYTPDFKGTERFGGRIVHPQQWSSDIETKGKRVVVIGSGATAVTLVPNLARDAAHVTMLQRSPSYVISLPSEDAWANRLNRNLPHGLAYGLTRWKKIILGMAFFKACKRWPGAMRKLMLDGVRKTMGSAFATDTHFSPDYKPWDQRVCIVPDNDLFKALQQGRASIVTDHIETLTENGIQLRSGAVLPADVIVTATGLDLLALGGMQISVDGKTIKLHEHLTYKGMMLSDVPNMAYVVGYTNASWTLKADLVSEYVCRLLTHMRKKASVQCTPRLKDSEVQPVNWIDFTSGYVQRSADKFPQQGNKAPWCLHQNYVLDIFNLRYGRLADGTLQFTPQKRKESP